ncbi:MAG: molybdenum cofactor biosynthesis protein MoaE [Arenicellaceae bacterium]|nr:molybdenum cofactor biosynthesis protein MoaE [Arenicellaceae bacterium]
MLSIQEEDFDIATEYAALLESASNTGAIVTFVGLVRDTEQGLKHMLLEHYPGMTENVIQQIIDTATQRWNIDEPRVIHRVGELQPTEQIVFVGISSTHRSDAYAACEYLMDQLKTRATLWKKEVTTDGEQWLDSKPSDIKRASRWNENPKLTTPS